MLSQIQGLGAQLRWAAAQPTPAIGTYSDVLYVGMGGSGIAGNYVGAIAEPFGTRVTIHKGYGPIAPWMVRQRPLVVAASYSGNTEETLDYVMAAHESGLFVATITTGGRLGELSAAHDWPSVSVPSGMQPRAAAGYMIGAALIILAGAHAVDDQRLALVEAADIADHATEEESDRWIEAASIAEGLRGRIPIIYGGGPVSGVVAQRWKTQINENAKVPSWWSVLPELDHNEITGWETMPETTREHVGIVALRDRSDHDRVARRLALTSTLTENAVPWVAEVESTGVSVLARLISLTAVGDLASVMLAESMGVDPVPVATIEKLKRLLVTDTEDN
jgi:glucose/mannose-6-phosphate isomerase